MGIPMSGVIDPTMTTRSPIETHNHHCPLNHQPPKMPARMPVAINNRPATPMPRSIDRESSRYAVTRVRSRSVRRRHQTTIETPCSARNANAARTWVRMSQGWMSTPFEPLLCRHARADGCARVAGDDDADEQDKKAVQRVERRDRRVLVADGHENRLQGEQDEQENGQADDAARQAAGDREDQDDQRQPADEVAEATVRREVAGGHAEDAQAGQEDLPDHTGHKEPGDDHDAATGPAADHRWRPIESRWGKGSHWGHSMGPGGGGGGAPPGWAGGACPAVMGAVSRIGPGRSVPQAPGGSRRSPPMPASRARTMASARSATWSLLKMFETWFRTVFVESPTRSVISSF